MANRLFEKKSYVLDIRVDKLKFILKIWDKYIMRYCKNTQTLVYLRKFSFHNPGQYIQL